MDANIELPCRHVGNIEQHHHQVYIDLHTYVVNRRSFQGSNRDLGCGLANDLF